jgi:hypothetical protein
MHILDTETQRHGAEKIKEESETHSITGESKSCFSFNFLRVSVSPW